jgi:hypothetical protein
MPMVMNAHMMAAKADTIWLREEVFMSMSFFGSPRLSDKR